MSCDLAIGLIATPELAALNQMIFKQLASRYGDPSYYKRFVVGVDKTRMRLYNVEQRAQSLSTEVGTTTQESSDRYKPKSKTKKKEVAAVAWDFDE